VKELKLPWTELKAVIREVIHRQSLCGKASQFEPKYLNFKYSLSSGTDSEYGNV
jgi:hypothetical protein